MKLTDPRLPIGNDVGRLTTSLYDVLRRIVTAVNRQEDSRVLRGSGTPEGNVVANVGALYTRTDGGAGSTLYVKESGDGLATGWIAK